MGDFGLFTGRFVGGVQLSSFFILVFGLYCYNSQVVKFERFLLYNMCLFGKEIFSYQIYVNWIVSFVGCFGRVVKFQGSELRVGLSLSRSYQIQLFVVCYVFRIFYSQLYDIFQFYFIESQDQIIKNIKRIIVLC